MMTKARETKELEKMLKEQPGVRINNLYEIMPGIRNMLENCKKGINPEIIVFENDIYICCKDILCNNYCKKAFICLKHTRNFAVLKHKEYGRYELRQPISS